MTSQRDPESLLRALAEERVPFESSERVSERRDQLVPALAAHIRQTHVLAQKRARTNRVIGWAAAASVALFASYGAYRSGLGQGGETRATASAAAIDVGVVKQVNGTLVITRGGVPRVVPIGERTELAAGDELRTAADGGVDLQTERSAIHVDAATQLSLPAPSRAEERVRLAAGRIELSVSKQPQARRSVVVETPNADVVVHGTMFSVAVEPQAGASVTRVRVSEGSVWVLHGGGRELLAAGDEWSSLDGRKLPKSAPAPAPVEVQPEVAPRAAPDVKTKSRIQAAANSSSETLSQENRLFQAAIEARNHGDDRKAIEGFSALLNRHPGGRLSEVARVEQMRAYRRLGDITRASAEARRYLAQYASGFAREEARGLVLGGSDK